MSGQPFRTGKGGLIDRDRPLNFTFNGRPFRGYEGDTLASALLANGVKLAGRSFKYHRPRGIFSAGPEEPNALLHVGPDEIAEPNTRATQVTLYEGLQAASQNHWPSLEFDLARLADLVSPLISAGFYNKTFKWPRRLWPGYEKLLRKAAGHGRSPLRAGPDRFEQCFRHCDVLIVGAGPAGLSAADRIAGTGLRVLLVDDGDRVGGWLLNERARIGGEDGFGWCRAVRESLDRADNVQTLTRTTAFGYFDHNLVALVENLPGMDEHGGIAQRLHRVRARQVILATGSIERPLVFANNDLPGIMLAGAARAYLNRFGVKTGERAVIHCDNDSAFRTALDLHDAGVGIAAVADLRDRPGEAALAALQERGIPLYSGARLAARGNTHLRSVDLCHKRSDQPVSLECDLLCVSGGWTPSLHLHSQSGGGVRFDGARDTFLPDKPRQQSITAGAVNGLHDLSACLSDGENAAEEAARRCGLQAGPGRPEVEAALHFDQTRGKEPHAGPEQAMRLGVGKKGKYFIDLQNDVTIADVQQAWRESYVSVEHLKRYTTLGMGTDQGKTSNLNGFELLASLRGETIPEVGLTTFRPPCTPVTLGTLAGRRHGARQAPVRRSPLHQRQQARGAVFDSNGLWLRPGSYPRTGETAAEAISREVMAVRNAVGMTDISTLGKFEIQGDDCSGFLDRVYVNKLDTLAVGRARYALMLRDDGMVRDDGTITRLADRHYFITASTGHAEHVRQYFEFMLDVNWPDLDVNLVDVTEQWAGIAVAGPRSRELLQCLLEPGADVLEPIPYMGFATAVLPGLGEGVEARLIRISYSGELAWEVYVPARSAVALWDLLLTQGESFQLQPYGMEAMDILRIEKGFIAVGAEADGRATPMDLGLGRMVSQVKPFFGQHGLARPALHQPGRLQLVGLRAVGSGQALFEGAQLIPGPDDRGYDASIGHISSAGYSPVSGRYVALAMLRDGRERLGQKVYVFDAARGSGEPVETTVIPPCVYDPDGKRLRA